MIDVAFRAALDRDVRAGHVPHRIDAVEERTGPPDGIHFGEEERFVQTPRIAVGKSHETELQHRLAAVEILVGERGERFTRVLYREAQIVAAPMLIVAAPRPGAPIAVERGRPMRVDAVPVAVRLEDRLRGRHVPRVAAVRVGDPPIVGRCGLLQELTLPLPIPIRKELRRGRFDVVVQLMRDRDTVPIRQHLRDVGRKPLLVPPDRVLEDVHAGARRDARVGRTRRSAGANRSPSRAQRRDTLREAQLEVVSAFCCATEDDWFSMKMIPASVTSCAWLPREAARRRDESAMRRRVGHRFEEIHPALAGEARHELLDLFVERLPREVLRVSAMCAAYQSRIAVRTLVGGFICETKVRRAGGAPKSWCAAACSPASPDRDRSGARP